MPAYVRVSGGPFHDAPRVVVRSWAEKMLAALDLSDSDLSVLLTNDARIHRLNRDYRGKNRPTDVLAFSMREGENGPTDAGKGAELLGDVIISVPTARKQARRERRPFADELMMLLAHGLLHLVGYDHQTAREERRMKRRTEKLCEAARAGVRRSTARETTVGRT